MSDICPSIGITDDGNRWACNLSPDHLRYGWEWHVALANGDCRPITTWRRHEGHDARYLAILGRAEPAPPSATDTKTGASAGDRLVVLWQHRAGVSPGGRCAP